VCRPHGEKGGPPVVTFLSMARVRVDSPFSASMAVPYSPPRFSSGRLHLQVYETGTYHVRHLTLLVELTLSVPPRSRCTLKRRHPLCL